jgi:hypothetical protein
VSMAGGYRQTRRARPGADEAWPYVEAIWKKSAARPSGHRLFEPALPTIAVRSLTEPRSFGLIVIHSSVD